MPTELYKQFKKENPQTIGETDTQFDMSNYIDWLELKLSPSIDWIRVENNKELPKEKTTLLFEGSYYPNDGFYINGAKIKPEKYAYPVLYIKEGEENTND